MNHLETEFATYIEACELIDPSPALIAAMRNAFFCGVLSTFWLHDTQGVAKRELVREVELWRAEVKEEGDLWRRRN